MTVPAPAAPRALTPPEKAELRARLEARLREAGEGDSPADEGLLAFVLDMAENGEAAGRVPEEVSACVGAGTDAVCLRALCIPTIRLDAYQHSPFCSS